MLRRFLKRLSFSRREYLEMATFADLILDIQTKVTALQTAVAALPTTSTPTTVDLTPVTTAITGVQTTVTGIDNKLGTPPT